MMRLARVIPATVVAFGMLACAAPTVIVPDPSLFVHNAALACGPAVPGRVALVVPPEVQGTMGAVAQAVRLQVGRIVEQALLANLHDCYQGGGQQLLSAPAAGSGFSATLVVHSVYYSPHSHTSLFVPVPLPVGAVTKNQFSAIMATHLSLLDTQGHVVWTQDLGDDQEAVGVSNLPGGAAETPAAGIGRQGHASASRLAQRAVREVRKWTDAQRALPRDL